jgi:hypothetical protein
MKELIRIHHRTEMPPQWMIYIGLRTILMSEAAETHSDWTCLLNGIRIDPAINRRAVHYLGRQAADEKRATQIGGSFYLSLILPLGMHKFISRQTEGAHRITAQNPTSCGLEAGPDQNLE